MMFMYLFISQMSNTTFFSLGLDFRILELLDLWLNYDLGFKDDDLDLMLKDSDP